MAARRKAGTAAWQPTVESTDVLGTMKAIDDNSSNKHQTGDGSSTSPQQKNLRGTKAAGSSSQDAAPTEAQQKKLMLRRLVSMTKDSEQPGQVNALQVSA
jgi:hypothetical protein